MLYTNIMQKIKTKDLPWQMNRQLTCASIRQGKKGKFRQSCRGGRTLQTICFVWRLRFDSDSRRRLRYFPGHLRGLTEFYLLQVDARI